MSSKPHDQHRPPLLQRCRRPYYSRVRCRHIASIAGSCTFCTFCGWPSLAPPAHLAEPRRTTTCNRAVPPCSFSCCSPWTMRSKSARRARAWRAVICVCSPPVEVKSATRASKEPDVVQHGAHSHTATSRQEGLTKGGAVVQQSARGLRPGSRTGHQRGLGFRLRAVGSRTSVRERPRTPDTTRAKGLARPIQH